MSRHDDAISARPGVTAKTPDRASETQDHSPSAQLGVERNPDPLLDVSNQHSHAHLHHGATTLGKDDDVVYAKGGSDNYLGSHAPAPDYKVHPMSSNDDEESGGVGEVRHEGDDEKAGWRRWTFKRVYRQYKIVFHLIFWGVWTA